MKKTLLFFGLFLALTLVQAQTVKFKINDGLDNTVLQSKIESNLSLLLTETDAAFRAGRHLDLTNVSITDEAAASLRMLWRNRPFLCGEPLIVERVLGTYDGGLEVRNIPVSMHEASGPESYQELVVDMDAAGTITLVNTAIANHLYRKVIFEGKDEEDQARRKLIVSYVERFRTAYDKKDINFMREIFSDEALIITGKVVRRGGKDRTKMNDAIEYKKQNKTEYLENLDRVFKQTRYIHVDFSDVKVTLDPTKDGYYGVTVKQGYTSDIYSDEGYVFMLWDFRDASHPQIHVRTWQPYWLNPEHTKALEENQIITTNSFIL